MAGATVNEGRLDEVGRRMEGGAERYQNEDDD